MDELEISGKRYISSRRAGKEHRYHPDYIGQLIRGGKVPGQKVGRSWYVDADALKAYFSGEAVAVPASNDAVAVVVSAEEPAPVIAQTKSPDVVYPQERITPLAPAQPTPHMGVMHLSVTDEEEPIAEVVDTQRGLHYVADDNELFPILKKQEIHTQHLHTPEVISVASVASVAAPISKARVSLLQIAVAGVLALVVTFGACALLTSELSVSATQSASASIGFAH